MTRQSSIGIGSVVIAGIVVGVTFGLSRHVPIQMSPSSTRTPAPTISSENCLPSELKSIVELDGAAGSINGSFTIQNISERKCTLAGENQISLNYESKVDSIKVTPDQPTQQKEYVLEPKQVLTATAHLPNGPQCSGKISPVAVTYTYAMSDGQKLTFTDSTGQKNFSLTACADSSDVTEVKTTSLSSQ